MKLFYLALAWKFSLACMAFDSSWKNEWKEEWNGEPWVVRVQGLDQTIEHAKTVWEWANDQPLHSITGNAYETFGELCDKLPFKSSSYRPPFKLKLHHCLKIDGYYLFAFPFLPTDKNTTSAKPPISAWIVMNAEGHVLWAFHWYYSSSYEFPWICAIQDQCLTLDLWRSETRKASLHEFPYDEYYHKRKDGRPVSLRTRNTDRVVYLLNSKTGSPRQLYIYSKGNCALTVYSSGEIDTLDWDFKAWRQYTHQQPEELEQLERILGKFIDIQMNPQSKPTSFREEIEKILPKARKRAKTYHAEQAKRREHIKAVYQQCSKLIGDFFPEFKIDQLSPLSLFCNKDIRIFLEAVNLPLNRFYPDAYVDAKFQVPYCTERWIKKIWKGDIDVYDKESCCRKRSFRCTLIPENRGRAVRIAYSIVQCATENLCREALADRWFWQPFDSHGDRKDSVENILSHTRIRPGLVGEYDLASTLRMNYRGVIIPESETSAIVFRRGNTVAALISSDPHYSVLPLAKKIDQALKKIYTPQT